MQEPLELSPEECRRLLVKGTVGRVGVCTPTGPEVIPVNYAVEEDSIVFRTTPYSKLGTYAADSSLAFEVDQLDYENHSGWSVVAFGRGRRVDDTEELRAIRANWDPQPWAGGRRWLYIRLPWRQLTGRRLRSELPVNPELPVGPRT